MAKRLHENLNSLYLGAAERLRSKKARTRIVAYVESYDDVFFWRTLLSEFESDKLYFEVMLPSRHSLAKGKKMVLSNFLGERLGHYMIACVDADYDYLMQGTTPTSRTVITCPYVFHTYAYAIENLQCYAETLHDVCVMATLNDKEIIDFAEFMRIYSALIHPLFVWSVWMYRHNVKGFSLVEFANYVSIDRVNIRNLQSTLEYIRRAVNRKVGFLQAKHPEAKEDYLALKEELIELGATPETTYLYIQGHALFNNVVLPLLEPVCKQLRREREKDIKQLAYHSVQMDNELVSYQRSQDSVANMLRKHTYFRASPLYQSIRRDIDRFVQQVVEQTASKEQEEALATS